MFAVHTLACMIMLCLQSTAVWQPMSVSDVNETVHSAMHSWTQDTMKHHVHQISASERLLCHRCTVHSQAHVQRRPIWLWPLLHSSVTRSGLHLQKHACLSQQHVCHALSACLQLHAWLQAKPAPRALLSSQQTPLPLLCSVPSRDIPNRPMHVVAQLCSNRLDISQS